MALLATVALGLFAAGVAVASIPGPDGVIHGCYKTNNPAQGAVIAIDHTATCPSGYTALNWNQNSGYEVVSTQISVTGAGQNWNGQATCPSGKVALGGGYELTPGGISGFSVEYDAINPGRTGWVVALDYTGSMPFTLNIRATCATV